MILPIFLTSYKANGFLNYDIKYQSRHFIWHYASMKSLKDMEDDRLGDEAPRLKDVIIVFVVVIVLTLLSLFAYHKLGWFH